MNIAEHLELHLGQMERGWSSSSITGIQVCLFRDQPTQGVVTLATLGLSDKVLSMNERRTVRQELLIAIHSDKEPEEFARLLLHVAERLHRDGRTLLRGDIISFESTVTADCSANALYASIPVVFPDGLATLKDTAPQTVVVWLFPLLPPEVTLIRATNWSEFEDRLEDAEPDLFNVCRDSIV